VLKFRRQQGEIVDRPPTKRVTSSMAVEVRDLDQNTVAIGKDEQPIGGTLTRIISSVRGRFQKIRVIRRECGRERKGCPAYNRGLCGEKTLMYRGPTLIGRPGKVGCGKRMEIQRILSRNNPLKN